MTSKLATLHELGTIYSVEDVYDMLEIALINNHNQRLFNKFYEQQAAQS